MNFRDYLSLIEEGKNYSLNVAKLSVKKAKEYAENMFSAANKSLYDEIPNFEENYLKLQNSCKKAIDVPRIEMPVIEPDDMDRFVDDISKGRVDIFKPYAMGSEYFPKDLKGGKEGAEFLQLGTKDAEHKDDVIPAQRKKIMANKLLPTQSQIWLEKLIKNIIKFGVPTQGSPITTATIIVSKEGYILDGHHRYGQAMLTNPTLKLDAIFVPMDIKLLLKVGRSYGNALGNKQKA